MGTFHIFHCYWNLMQQVSKLLYWTETKLKKTKLFPSHPPCPTPYFTTYFSSVLYFLSKQLGYLQSDTPTHYMPPVLRWGQTPPADFLYKCIQSSVLCLKMINQGAISEALGILGSDRHAWSWRQLAPRTTSSHMQEEQPGSVSRFTPSDCFSDGKVSSLSSLPSSTQHSTTLRVYFQMQVWADTEPQVFWDCVLDYLLERQVRKDLRNPKARKTLAGQTIHFSVSVYTKTFLYLY